MKANKSKEKTLSLTTPVWLLGSLEKALPLLPRGYKERKRLRSALVSMKKEQTALLNHEKRQRDGEKAQKELDQKNKTAKVLKVGPFKFKPRYGDYDDVTIADYRLLSDATGLIFNVSDKKKEIHVFYDAVDSTVCDMFYVLKPKAHKAAQKDETKLEKLAYRYVIQDLLMKVLKKNFPGYKIKFNVTGR